MAKIPVSISDTQFDPLKNENTIERLAGITSADKPLPKTGILSADGSLETLSNVDSENKYSLLGDSNLTQQTIEETKAQNETAIGLAGKMLYNIGSTFLTETAKIPGYLGGLALGVTGKLTGDPDPFIKSVVDNAWVNAFDSLDKIIKDQVPVHMTKMVQDGNLFDKATSGAFWAQDGAEAIGFLLSMMLPGQALKAIGVGAKIGSGLEAIGNSSKYIGKLASKSGALVDLAKSGKLAATADFIKGADSVAAAAFNTFTESAAEAGNTFDNVKKNYLAQGLTEEEANQKAGDAASGVFKANLALLIVSNLLDEAWLWKGFSHGEKEADSVISKIFKDGKLDTESLNNITKKGWKDIAWDGIKNFGKSFAKEGFFEEGSQTLLQNNIEKDGSKGILDDLGNIYANYFNELVSNQGLQESIFLGGILGGGMSFIETKRDVKDYNDQLFGTEASTPVGLQKLYKTQTKATPGIINLFKDNFLSNYQTLLDVAEKDSDGKIIYKDGKPVIREDKLAELANNKVALLDANYKYDIAVQNGDTQTKNQIGNMLAMNYFMPFFQQEGGRQILDEHIKNQLPQAWAERYQQSTGVEATEQQKLDYAKELKEKADKLGETYENVKNTHYPQRYYVSDDPLYKDWVNEHFYDKLQLSLALDSIDEYNKKISENELKYGYNLDELESMKDKLDPRVYAVAKQLKETKKLIDSQKEDIKDIYTKLFTREGVKQAFEEYKQSKEQQIKDLQEDVKEDLTKAANQKNNSFSESIINAGYDVVKFQAKNDKGQLLVDTEGKPIMKNYLKETIIVKDKNGKRYSLKSVLDPKTSKVTTTIYNSQGKAKELTSKIISDLELTPVSKDQLKAEKRLYDLQRRKEAQLEAINQIHQTLNATYQVNIKEIEEINNKLNNYKTKLKDLKSKLKNYNNKENKMSKTEFYNVVKDLESTIKSLETRKSSLERGIVQINAYNQEVVRLQELIDQDKIQSIQSEVNKAEQSLLDNIKEIEQIDDLGKTVTQSQEIINKSEDQIFKLNEQLDALIQLRDELKQHIIDDDFFKALTLNVKLKKHLAIITVKDLFKFANVTTDTIFKKIENYILNNDLKGLYSDNDLKSALLKRTKRIAENLSTYNQAKALDLFKKTDVTTKDVFDYLMDSLGSITEAEEQLNLTATEKALVEEKLELVNADIENIKNKINHVFDKLDLERLNKQYLALVDIVSKAKDNYQSILDKRREQELDPANIQPKELDEPTEPDEKSFDEFYNHSLGSNLFTTTGLNILYDQSKNDVLIQEGSEKGLPQQNDSQYQRVWFKTLDRIARSKTDSLDNYQVLIYSPNYESNSLLDEAIKINNPNRDPNGTKELFAVLVDKQGKPITVDPNGNHVDGGTPVFSSIWKPESLFPKDKQPRLNLNALYRKFLIKSGINLNIDINDQKAIDRLSQGDKTKLTNRVGELTSDNIKQAAINDAKKEYTEWYNKAVDLNSKGNTLITKPLGITRGKVLKRRNLDTRAVEWNSVLDNTDVTLDKKSRFGPKALQGGRLVSTTTGFVKIGTGAEAYNITVPRGDTVLVLDNESNVLPLKARNINKSEIELVMFLMSLGNQEGPAAAMTVPLPEGVYYSFNDVNIKNQVPIFFSNNKDYKNFSLLHSIISYGKKNDKENKLTPNQKKGEIYVATNTKQIIYTDWNGNKKALPLSELVEAIQANKFSDYNENIADLYEFLKNKRFNVSAGLISRNGVFPYPKLVKSNKGMYVDFDTKNSYYEFLLDGKEPVLTTNAVVSPNYPSFVQRNLIFDNTLEESKPETKEIKAEPFVESKPDFQQDVFKTTYSKIESKVNSLNSIEEIDGFLNGKYKENIASLKEKYTEEVDKQDIALLEAKVKELVNNKSAELYKPEVAESEPAEEVKPESKELSIEEQIALKKKQIEADTPPLRMDDLFASDMFGDSGFKDKIITPEEILKNKLINNEIQQECK